MRSVKTEKAAKNVMEHKKTTAFSAFSAVIALLLCLFTLASCAVNTPGSATPAPEQSGSPQPTAGISAEPSGQAQTPAPQTDKPTDEPSETPSSAPASPANLPFDFGSIPEFTWRNPDKGFIPVSVKTETVGTGGNCSFQCISAYPAWEKMYAALDRLNQTFAADAYLKYGSILRSGGGRYIQKIYLRRADHGYLSILIQTFSGSGEAVYSAENISYKNGERVLLNELISNFSALPALINEQLAGAGFTVSESYLLGEGESAPVWTLDRDGICFVFNSGEYGGARLDSPTAVLVPYSLLESAERLEPLTENGSMELPLELPAYYVENGEVKRLDLSSVVTGGDIDWKPYLHVENGERSASMYHESSMNAPSSMNGSYINLVSMGETRRLYVFDTGDGYYRVLGILELTGEKPFEFEYGGDYYIYDRLIDPKCFRLGIRSSVLSHTYGNKVFELGEDGMPVPVENYYDLTDYYCVEADAKLFQLYALKAFDAAERSFEDESLSVFTVRPGMELTYSETTDFMKTDTEGEFAAYCVLSATNEDNTELHNIIVRVDARLVGGDYYFTVNGENIFELFAGMDFYRSEILPQRPLSGTQEM